MKRVRPKTSNVFFQREVDFDPSQMMPKLQDAKNDVQEIERAIKATIEASKPDAILLKVSN